MYKYVKSSTDIVSALESSFYKSLRRAEAGKNKLEELQSAYDNMSTLHDIKSEIESIVSDAAEKYLPSGFFTSYLACSIASRGSSSNSQLRVDIDYNNARYVTYHFVFSTEYDYMRLYESRDIDERFSDFIDEVESTNISSIMDDLISASNIYNELDKYRKYQYPIQNAYTALFSKLLKVKKDYLLRSDKDSSTFIQISSRTGNGVWVKAGYNFIKLKWFPDDFVFEEIAKVHFDSNYFHWKTAEKSLRDMGLPVDGTCPTIVSIEEYL